MPADTASILRKFFHEAERMKGLCSVHGASKGSIYQK